MQTTFDVLVDPHRRQILALLRSRPHAVGELVEHTGLAQSGVSRHLRILREAGFVTVTREAQSRVYRLEPARFQELDQWLADYRTLWSRTLDALGDLLETLPSGTTKESDQ